MSFFNNYRIERLTPNHYKDLNYISKSAFGFCPGIDYYKRKNETENFGATNLGFIAYHIDTEEPAAFYGVYSYPVVHNDKKVLADQSGDTMKHKNHTGKGLFIELAKRTYKLAKDHGAKFVFGFPNQNSYPGFVKKLNWIHDGHLQLFQFKVFTFPLLKAAKKYKFFRPFYNAWFSFIRQFYKVDLDKNLSIFEGGESFCVSHNIDFIKYKSFCGSIVIKINGSKTWIKADGFLYIGDIERNAAVKLKNYLSKLKQFAFLIGADKIIFGASKNSFWYSKFTEIVSPNDGIYLGYYIFEGELPMKNFSYVYADLDTF